MTTSHKFLFIEPGHVMDLASVARAVRAEQLLHDTILDAVSLADSAADFFRGVFPLETPYACWGEGRWLPWSGEKYWLTGAGADSIQPQPIRDEVDRIVVMLEDVAAREGKLDGPYTYLSNALCESDQLKVQGLAVEAMLAVDLFLQLVFEGKPREAMRCLSAAYKCIIECVCQAHLILGKEAAGDGPQAGLH